jgi:transcriptional regulator
MQIRKVIQRRIRKSGGGVDFASDVNAVISANVDRGHSVRAVPKREASNPPKTEERGGAHE